MSGSAVLVGERDVIDTSSVSVRNDILLGGKKPKILSAIMMNNLLSIGIMNVYCVLRRKSKEELLTN